jgi:hypothetical protein
MGPDIGSLKKEAPVNIALPAAKLNLLQLEPIKARIGDRWPRMSLLVHSLFERALRREQGPQDHFTQLEELSYVVTFHDRSPAEAAAVCSAIAREVCERLFGEGVEDVSVRSVVGEITHDQLNAQVGGSAIADFLEQTGVEKIVTKSSAPPEEECEQARRAVDARAPGHAVLEAHRFMEQLGRRLGFFPLWDLKKHSSSVLFLSPVGGKSESAPHAVNASMLLPQAGDGDLSKLELRLLRAAGEYAQRVHASQKVCAVGTGVSYDTLSSFSGRVRYITTLKEIHTTPICPLLLKIESIPQGVHLGRLNEIMNMVAVTNVRFMLEFSERIPELESRMGAAGIGAVLAEDCSAGRAEAILKSLPNRLLRQQAFGYVSGLNTPALARLAETHNLRFGLGAALSRHHYTGLETVPDFPVSL